MSKGFTLIELLIFVGIIAIVAVVIIVKVSGEGFKMSCDMYNFTPQKDIPAMCIKYFNGENEKTTY